MHLCFLGLYAFVILFSFHKPPRPSDYEIVLLCWVGVIIADEIRQVNDRDISPNLFKYCFLLSPSIVSGMEVAAFDFVCCRLSDFRLSDPFISLSSTRAFLETLENISGPENYFLYF